MCNHAVKHLDAMAYATQWLKTGQTIITYTHTSYRLTYLCTFHFQWVYMQLVLVCSKFFLPLIVKLQNNTGWAMPHLGSTDIWNWKVIFLELRKRAAYHFIKIEKKIQRDEFRKNLDPRSPTHTQHWEKTDYAFCPRKNTTTWPHRRLTTWGQRPC